MVSQNDLRELVHHADRSSIAKRDIDAACATEKISASALFDAFARDVAEGYSQGRYSFTFCDGAINNLYSYAVVFSDMGLPPFAWSVFEAFDQGELRGEQVTEDLLATWGYERKG